MRTIDDESGTARAETNDKILRHPHADVCESLKMISRLWYARSPFPRYVYDDHDFDDGESLLRPLLIIYANTVWEMLLQLQ